MNKKVWNCRFHPTDGWHEVGCPHKFWTKKEIEQAGNLKSIDYEVKASLLKTIPFGGLPLRIMKLAIKHLPKDITDHERELINKLLERIIKEL